MAPILPADDRGRPLLLDRLAVTVDEAATLLAMSRSRIYELMGRKEIGYFHEGASRRIPLDELRQFVVRRMTLND